MVVKHRKMNAPHSTQIFVTKLMSFLVQYKSISMLAQATRVVKVNLFTHCI
ncbi:hypothetical protein DAI22_08g130532 [Oryza sativa Japonica Group]|nr:hypothetical protein DAI22_08g130532 [Oryza sativa Japonica Group]